MFLALQSVGNTFGHATIAAKVTQAASWASQHPLPVIAAVVGVIAIIWWATSARV